MKKAILIIATILAAILVGLIGLIAYLGGFQGIQVSEKKAGPFYIVYTNHVGAYHKIGPVFERLQKDIGPKVDGDVKMMGIYYDDPATIAEDKLRSAAAMVLTKADYQKLANSLPDEYKLRTLPERLYIRSEFPLKSNLSYMVGAMKVYPALGEYVEKMELPEPQYSAKDYENNYALELEQDDIIEYLMVHPKG